MHVLLDVFAAGLGVACMVAMFYEVFRRKREHKLHGYEIEEDDCP